MNQSNKSNRVSFYKKLAVGLLLLVFLTIIYPIVIQPNKTQAANYATSENLSSYPTVEFRDSYSRRMMINGVDCIITVYPRNAQGAGVSTSCDWEHVDRNTPFK